MLDLASAAAVPPERSQSWKCANKIVRRVHRAARRPRPSLRSFELGSGALPTSRRRVDPTLPFGASCEKGGHLSSCGQRIPDREEITHREESSAGPSAELPPASRDWSRWTWHGDARPALPGGRSNRPSAAGPRSLKLKTSRAKHKIVCSRCTVC